MYDEVEIEFVEDVYWRFANSPPDSGRVALCLDFNWEIKVVSDVEEIFGDIPYYPG